MYTGMYDANSSAFGFVFIHAQMIYQWENVRQMFKIWPSKICGSPPLKNMTRYSRMDQVKFV